ncbi:MAG: DUF1850 domain-containing protein [Lachnospiraceae bacterium]|nr:DUF1850 domain-containing protein [Lachnospiraceae bacterium]
MALLFLSNCSNRNIASKKLILYNYTSGEEIASFPLNVDSHFYIKFNHSVNMSPVIDYYRFNEQNEIYVYKTIYYNYGAGVETELENDESLEFGSDGSMIIENINKKINPLTYYLSNLYDHKLSIDDKEEISLWDICGKNILINIIIK